MGIVMAEAARLQPTATCPCKQKRPTKGACEEDAGVACFQPKVNFVRGGSTRLRGACQGWRWCLKTPLWLSIRQEMSDLFKRK